MIKRAWPFVVTGGVLALITWAYVSAHGLHRMPRNHPWPAITLGALAALTFGIRGETRTMVAGRFGAGAVALAAALVWALSS